MALFFILTSHAANVEPDKSKSPVASTRSETYKDLISKAQVLLLQKDRAQSINILLMGLQKEDSKSIGFQELAKKLYKVSHMFLGESAQSTFELAITLDKSNKKLAIDKLNEALAIEPQNLQIIKGLVLRYLSDNSCSKAQKLMESFKQINPYDPELISYEVHLSVCQKDHARIEVLKKENKDKDGDHTAAEIWVLAEYRLNPNSSLLNTEMNQKLDMGYPEILFSKWKYNETKALEKNILAETYLQKCKIWKTPYFGTNFPDPWVCTNIKEVEENKEKK